MGKSNPDRVKELAAALNTMDAFSRDKLLANVAAKDANLAAAIKKAMFVFADLAKMAKPDLQVLIKQIPEDTWALAMRNANDETKNAIFSAMTGRSAGLLQERIVQIGKQRLSDVEAAQNTIVETALTLASDKKISLTNDMV